MVEPFDIYADTFWVRVTPWGANLKFMVSEPPPIENEPPRDLGTVRMSSEHLKVMVYILRNQIIRHEYDSRTFFDVPDWVLEQIGATREEWDSFWGRLGG